MPISRLVDVAYKSLLIEKVMEKEDEQKSRQLFLADALRQEGGDRGFHAGEKQVRRS